VSELARLYESLLGFGTPILDRATIDRFTSPWRGRLYDENLQDEVDWGLGFKTSSTFFGCQSVTGRVFGHTGLGSSFYLALPDYGVVVVWVSNVISPPPVHRARIRRVMPALLGCLQLEAKPA
jgi:CubicO group peptidase (beta-lactamase class C family)